MQCVGVVWHGLTWCGPLWRRDAVRSGGGVVQHAQNGAAGMHGIVSWWATNREIGECECRAMREVPSVSAARGRACFASPSAQSTWIVTDTPILLNPLELATLIYCIRV